MAAYVILELAPMRPTTHAAGLRRVPGGVTQLLAKYVATLFPGVDEASPGASTTLTVQVPDMRSALALASELRRVSGVNAAYAKPAEELP